MSLPTPRRTNRATPHLEPARTPPRRYARASSSRPTSRLATPVRIQDKDRLPPVLDNASHVSSAGASMDIDEESFPQTDREPKPDTVFAKSKEFTVSLHSHLPEEVRHLLRNADFFRGAYSGDVDPTTEFSLVTTAQTCYIWQHTQALTGAPTCYIFPCPADRVVRNPPFHAFVPRTNLREPGLILMSPTGEIRFWDNIGIGLAGGDHYFKAVLDLKAGETATSLIRSDPQTYVVSTSEGNLYRLNLTSSGGKHHLASRRFSRPQSSFSLSSIFPLLAPTALHPESGNIATIALGETSNSGRDVWAIVDKHVQQWNMTAEGWEMLVRQHDIRSILVPEILDHFGAASDAVLDLELLDMASGSRPNGRLDVLVSHVPLVDVDSMSMMDVPRRMYMIVQLDILVDSLQVIRIITVPYQSTFGLSQPPVAPQLQLMLNGLLFVVQFGDAITICARDNDYQDRIVLKSAEDRTLGVGVIDAHSELLILSATTLMKVVVDYDEVSAFDYESGQSGLIKDIMTQAILYGSYPGNPLHFGFPPEVDEDSLMSGAEMLSTAILKSDFELVKDSNDISSQIATRKERLSFLIKFINENGVLGKVGHVFSQRTRQRLAIDAEKLHAAHQLWSRFDEFLAQGHRRSVVNDAIIAYMFKIGEGHHEDLVRAFFRLHVTDLGRLVPYIWETTRDMERRRSTDRAMVLSESGTAILTILDCALEYREYNKGVYGLELPLLDPWTSGDHIMNALLKVYESNLHFVSGASDYGSDTDIELKSRLPNFAAVIFACFTERIGYLTSFAFSDPKMESARVVRQALFDDLRPTILQTDLIKHGFVDDAFHLAEKYLDYRNLAALCNMDVVYPPDQNPYAARTVDYVRRFREPFASELLQWYITNGAYRKRGTFTETERLGEELMDKFLTIEQYPAISWIHDLRKERFSPAADALIEESRKASDVAVRQVMLSIGRLAYLAEEQEGAHKGYDQSFDLTDALGALDVQNEIFKAFHLTLAEVHGRHPIDKQVELISRAKAARIAGTRAQLLVFKQLVKKILLGKALAVEELADVLSLKDNTEEDKYGKVGVHDYATALHLLSRAKELPTERREAAFAAVWRRVYLHDDWHEIHRTAGKTDGESRARFEATALYETIRATVTTDRLPPGYVLSPSQSAEPPSPAVIQARHAGAAPEQLEALITDAQAECNEVLSYELDEDFERAKSEVVLARFGGRSPQLA
ncbi:hypothetical protein K488DRAFT_44136 [Vararia minispora EC-137]|uniref:Uncharacterized protein n=1 Tax=Vararia minispora EC-137 TaxID=1314806 RepID=A0ACB8QTV5_9AGAM|nr:hypothetical protein K488DRAFT_44136 [Vararia minispora EC-137]